jgi:hypothetical protein
MADHAKTGPAPVAPNSGQQPHKTMPDTLTDTKPAAAPIAAAKAAVEPKKS